MSTDNETLIKALRILARDIVSDDGVANACVDEAAARIEELAGEIHSCPACRRNCKECECTEKQIESLKAENAELSRLRAAVGHMQQEINTLRSREMNIDDIADYSEDRAKLKAENDQLKLAKAELVDVLSEAKGMFKLGTIYSWPATIHAKKYAATAASEINAKINAALAKHGGGQ